MKRLIFAFLVVVCLFVAWILVVNHVFPTNYDSDELIEETAKCVYGDLVNLTPYIKRSGLSYLMKLDNGTYVYVPKYARNQLLDEADFQKIKNNQLVIVEYDPNIGHSYQVNVRETVNVHKVISLKSSDHEYISRVDYIRITNTIKKEYIVSFIAVVFLAVVYLFISFWSGPYAEIKRIIIQNKKRKLKRAKREAYRKKYSKTADVTASSKKTPE